MTTYYVRKTGDDSAGGTTPGTAWQTIGKAASTMAAGDTVYIGAGFYNETVTLTVSGSAGSPIVYIGDVSGRYTDDAGLVILDGSDEFGLKYNPTLILAGMTFVEFESLNLCGSGTTTINTYTVYSDTGNCSFEGVIFRKCFLSTWKGSLHNTCIYIDYNTAVTPTTTGLTFSKCYFYGGGIDINWLENAVAEVNLKIVVDHCIFDGGIHTVDLTGGAALTFHAGGVQITNNTFRGPQWGPYCTNARSTTYLVTMANNLFYRISGNPATLGAGSTAGAFVSLGNNIMVDCEAGFNNLPYADGDAFYTGNGKLLQGGINDFTLYQEFGWSPYKLFEFFSPTLGLSNVVSKRANPAYLVGTDDIYGNPMSSGGEAILYGWFNASDDAISDPGAKWTSEATIVDSDPTSSGTCTTTGSDASNYVFAGGTSLTVYGTITQVRARIRCRALSSAATGNLHLYTDGLAEDLLTITWNGAVSTAEQWTSWATLATPTGGWTSAKLAALEFKAWRTGTGLSAIYIFIIELEVTTQGGAADVGAVQSRNPVQKEVSIVKDGSYSIRFDGAGVFNSQIPVIAAETTISIWARKNSSYAGTDYPRIVVSNIPGVADQSDAMTSTTDTWEQLSVTFTPTSNGWIRLRMESRDTGYGATYFDDMRAT